MKEFIKIDNVNKTYGSKLILKNINLSIKAGTAICLLGRNGSGKSTLLKIIAGITNPSSGNVIYNGKLKISYIPDRFPKLDMTMHQLIMHMGLIEGLDKLTINKMCLELYEKFFISSMQDTKLKYLSKGSLQKVAVIQALLTKSDVILMDEPISGQDLLSQHSFIQTINELKRQKIAIVVCCHEKILIDHIVDKSYEIVDGILTQRIIQNFQQAKYAILHLCSNGNNESSLNDITHLLREKVHEESYVKVKVKREYADDVILFLLKKKWTLLSMSMEDNLNEIHI